MIRKYCVLLVMFFSAVQFVHGQDQYKKIRVQSVSSVGLLNGGKGSSLALQTIIGAACKHSFVGIGAGLDYYYYRSVPLFVDIRHEFGKGSRSMFLYGDVGYNYDWVAKGKTDQPFYTPDLKFSGGLYYDGGIGYKFGFNKSDALLISLGYTVKKMKSEVGSGVCPLIGPCYEAIQTYRYNLSRLVIKAGWRF